MFYIECIDATTQQLLLRLLTGCCYALRSTQLANTLPSLMQRPKIFSSISKLQQIFSFLLSLMLRSKIFSSSFQHQPFYAQRSSQLSNIQIRSSLFRHHRCCALRFLLFFLTFYPHWCYVFRFYFHLSPIVPSLMLRSKNFSSIFKHVWCYALRYSLRLSNILEATFQDLYFKFETSVMLRAKIFSSNFPTSLTRLSKIFFSMFWHHQCCALRSSFQVLNITDP